MKRKRRACSCGAEWFEESGFLVIKEDDSEEDLLFSNTSFQRAEKSDWNIYDVLCLFISIFNIGAIIFHVYLSI